MGSGKSSVGRRLSELLCCPFMDLDEVIEGREGRKIPEIFASDGEAEFRRMEHEALKMIIDEYSSSTGGDVVLALGGGTVMTPECAGLINEHTYCIYLRASLETLVSRLVSESAGRPMLHSPAAPSEPSAGPGALCGQSPAGTPQPDADALRDRISGLMALRSSTYESIARHTIDTDGKTIDEIAICISLPTSNRTRKRF